MQVYKKETIIHFSDCDQAGILFFANVFKICHDCYEEMLRSNLPETDYFKHQRIALPLKHSEALFNAPLTAGMKVEIQLVVEKVSTSSYTINYHIFYNGVNCADVRTSHVSIDTVKFTKVNLPEDLSDVLNRFLLQ